MSPLPQSDVPQLSEAQIERLVTAFYVRVRQDAALAPVFDAAIDDWEQHVKTLASFWSSVMFATGMYKGNPMIVHRKHAARITPDLFTRWLAVWTATTNELLSPADAAALQAKAARMATHLQQGLAAAT